MRNKIWMVILFVFFTKLFAENNENNTDLFQRYEIESQSSHLTTPNAAPKVNNGIDAFITAAFIYQTIRMEDLGYAYKGVNTTFSASVPKGSVHYPDWNWKSGFKLGLGLHLPHDSWNIYGEYTWLHSYASDSVNTNPSDTEEGNLLYPMWNIAKISTSSQNINSAKTSWNIRFNTLDLTLGRSYYISQFLIFRPFIGFKGGWSNQDYHVHYNVTDQNQLLDSNIRMKNIQDYWGLGLRGGINSTWNIYKFWGFYGDFAINTLWSQFNTKRQDIRRDITNSGGANTPLPNTDISILNIDNKFHTITAVFDLGLGIQGDWWFLEDRFHFQLKGGWEEQIWFNFNKLFTFDSTSNGNLMLQGLIVKARFDF